MIAVTTSTYLYLILFVFTNQLFAQSDLRSDPLSDSVAGQRRAQIISGVAIFGNTITKPEIILRELTLQIGDTISHREIEYCKSRLYSLGLFNRVEITYPPMDSTILIIEVDERWYLYPVPMVGIGDRDLTKWYYGLGIMHQNFRGRNEKIFAGFVLGYNPWVNLNYSNPWIFGQSELFFETNLGFQKVLNKSLVSRGDGANFDEIHYYAFETLGKRFNQYQSAWISIGFNYVEVTDNIAGRTVSRDGVDRYIYVAFGAKHDSRNLREYPTNGIYCAAQIAKKGIGFGDVDFLSYYIDGRLYEPIFDGPSLGLRIFTRLSSGPVVPNYEHHYFGYLERIRGHFHDHMEGENIAGASAELRIPIIPVYYLYLPAIPIPQFATWKLGLYSAAFFDAGTTWSRKEHPVQKPIPFGFGTGIHFLLPYSVIFRIDRAWDERGQGQWIFDVGASF